ncbi:MAG: hypothetical protein HOM37_09605, partial [Acidimicrobiaceae bacterium]|nr:hypothetical protein [Acidimicrobiaceae bacterium]
MQVTDEAANDLPGGSTTTASDGTFTITGITIEEIGIRIDGEAVDYESGFVGCRTSRYGSDVWPTFGEACTISPGFTADIALDRTFLSARVLDSATGLPVGGARVQVTDEGANDLPGASTTTASDGTFTITGITIEE